MEKKKSKGKLIALIIAIVVVVGVVTTGIVLAATGTLFGSTKEKAFDLLKQAPEKMTQSAGNLALMNCQRLCWKKEWISTTK